MFKGPIVSVLFIIIILCLWTPFWGFIMQKKKIIKFCTCVRSGENVHILLDSHTESRKWLNGVTYDSTTSAWFELHEWNLVHMCNMPRGSKKSGGVQQNLTTSRLEVHQNGRALSLLLAALIISIFSILLFHASTNFFVFGKCIDSFTGPISQSSQSTPYFYFAGYYLYYCITYYWLINHLSSTLNYTDLHIKCHTYKIWLICRPTKIGTKMNT